MSQLITSAIRLREFKLSLHCRNRPEPCAICCLHFHPVIWRPEKAAFLLSKQTCCCFTILFLFHCKERVNRTDPRKEWSIYFYMCVLHAPGLPRELSLGLRASYSVWAAGSAWGNWAAQTDALYCRVALQSSDMCLLCLSVSAAFLGDIALDEEDLRMFKVDRIIDVAQRTVQIVNHTDTGKAPLERLQLEVKSPH